MSRKNHKVVNGRLLKTDKRFSDLKERQKSKIAEWFYAAYRERHIREEGSAEKEADVWILDFVMERMEEEGIWLPCHETVSYYRRRKGKLKERFHKEKERNTEE